MEKESSQARQNAHMTSKKSSIRMKSFELSQQYAYALPMQINVGTIVVKSLHNCVFLAKVGILPRMCCNML
jgi:hypothetical protein